MADRKQTFTEQFNTNYSFKGTSVVMGAPILDGEVLTNNFVKIPLRTLNRHGLISGATGTGKTKTLQVLAEGLSANSVPVLMMDVKGDLSGIAAPGTANEKIQERATKIGINYSPQGFPVEFLSLSEQKGVRLRSTVSEFGPVLFSKMLELNDTQRGLVSMMFKYADDKNLPLLDLKDFKKLLQYLSNEGKKEAEETYGVVSTTSTGTILRKVIELEQQGADLFFGEKSFEPEDLLRIDENGKGLISIVRLTDIQNKPKLFSTFMLCLLAEIYNTFPEEGDLDAPKLVVFIDEAHLVFKEASSDLLEQIETIIKLIRSKGVGVIFCTQNPTDIPQSVLSQLGLKVQHALRAFTALDRKMIKQVSENYPLTDFYKTDELLTSLGIGEAAVTVLNEKGNPTMLSATLLCPPASRMGILTDEEINMINSKSALVAKYSQVIDRESAYEILMNKIQTAAGSTVTEEKRVTKTDSADTFNKILKSPIARSIGVAIAGTLTRSLLGSMGLKTRSSSSRKKRSSFF